MIGKISSLSVEITKSKYFGQAPLTNDVFKKNIDSSKLWQLQFVTSVSSKFNN